MHPFNNSVFITTSIGIFSISKLLPTAILLASTQQAFSADYDFYIMFDTCKATLAPLMLAEDPIRTTDGDPVALACTRTSGKMQCDLEVGTESTEQVWDINLDNPPFLMIQTDGGADVVTIHTTNHAAVISSRLASSQYLGAKVCHGTFATSSELEAMAAAKKADDSTQ